MGDMADMILDSWDPMDYEGDFFGGGQYQSRKPTYNRNSFCPVCNAPMVKRTGKYGTFAGCSAFPKCRTSGHWEELPLPPPPIETTTVTIEFECPKHGCNGCKFHSIVEVIEVGMSPDEHWCSLFDEYLGISNVDKCEQCKNLMKNGSQILNA